MEIAITLKKSINELSVHELKNAFLNGDKLTFAVSSMEIGGTLLGDYYVFNLVSVSDEPPTETPEEKEALDTIEQVEWKKILRSSIKFAKHERSTGEGSVRVGDGDLTDDEFLIMCHNIAAVTEKPESPEQRKEREAVENLRDAIQQCEEVGLRVFHDKQMITGAVINKEVVELS